MTSVESLEKFGTLSLGEDFIRERVTFAQGPSGKPRLSLNQWLAFVPEVFRPGVMSAIQRSAGSLTLSNSEADNLDAFTKSIQKYINIDAGLGFLDREGWRGQGDDPLPAA